MDRDALADFLRRRREALQPDAVGLSKGRRRRAAGLRREEVAALAGISADFYARLEQGRGSRPSATTLAAVAAALRLTPDERDHVLRLAGHHAPPRGHRGEHPSPGLVSVLEQLHAPALIVSDLGVALKQNALAEELLGVLTGYTGLARCLPYRWFTDPDERRRFPREDHELCSLRYAAKLRAAQSRSADDREVRDLVAELLRRSCEFRAIWDQHDIGDRTNTVKRILHPEVGLLTLTCQILTSQNQMENLVVFTATRGSEDAARLARLARLAERRSLRAGAANGRASVERGGSGPESLPRPLG
ncbi:MAG: helix-turn-helix transcriptional regulator [Minicystis sp.]